MSERFDFTDLSKETMLEAEKRGAEVRERGETKLFVFPEEGDKRNNSQEILVGARMQGAINSLIPVVKELRRMGYKISFLADQPAEKTLLNNFPELVEKPIIDPLQTVSEINPSLILSGLSINGGPGIEFYLAADAEGDPKRGIKHIPTVWVEDYWKASVRGQQEHKVFPDAVCTFDAASRDLDEQELKKDKTARTRKTKFFVTGSPAFDQLFQEKDLEDTKKRVRAELGVGSNDLLITYVGGMPPTDLENLRLLIGSLNEIDFGDKKPAFVARIHPAIFANGPLAVHKKEYESILSGLKACKVVETMGKLTTDEVAKATDAIISDFSTEGIKAVYRGKLSLFMLFPELGLRDLKRDTGGMETLPVIKSGAGVGVFEEENLTDSLSKLLLDKDFQRQLRKSQRKHHKLDGKNTERVAQVIKKLIKK